MKSYSNKFKAALLAMWKDESAQGATEYILLVVVIVALVAAFRQPIINAITTKMGDVSSQIQGFGGSQ